MSKFAPVAGAIAGVVLVVGGVVAAQAMSGPDTQPAPVVQPVATAPPSPTTTTATPSPTVTVAPKPVESSTSAAPKPAPKIVQRQATVAQEPAPQTTTSEPSTVVTGGAGTSTKIQPGQQPIVVAPASTPPPASN